MPDVLSDGAFEPSARHFVIMERLDLSGAGFSQGGLSAEYVQLGPDACVVQGGCLAKGFFGLFLHFFLRLQNLLCLDETGIGGSHFLLDAADVVGQINSGSLMQGLGLADSASCQETIPDVPGKLHAGGPAVQFAS